MGKNSEILSRMFLQKGGVQLFERLLSSLVLVASIWFAPMLGLAQVPAINSFSPAAAQPGETIAISGTNFGGTVAANTVFFGAVKALPISASATSLQVQVPSGATYAPITVEVTGGKSAQSNRPFTPLFSPGGPITNYSFGQVPTTFPPSGWPPVVNLTAGLSGPTQGAVIADFDGDGKPDLAVANWNINTVAVFRNVQNGGDLSASSFTPAATLAVGSRPIDIAVGDLNGDGLPDLVIANNLSNTISIFQNTSTPGTISFAAAGTLSAAAISVKLADIDGDGWLDIVTCFSNVAVLRNQGLGGNLSSSSFGTAVQFTVPGFSASDLAVGDIDGDRKPDLLVAGGSKVFVYRNTATAGTIASNSFATPLQLTASSSPTAVALADLDGDGRPELVVGTATSTLSIFPNQSTPGSLSAASFGTRIDLQISAYSQWALHVSVADLNGDGRPEILIANRFSPGVLVAVNSGAANLAGSFTSFVGLNLRAGDAALGNYGHVVVGDLNGDGRPDLVVDGESSKLQVSQNFVRPLTTTSFTISPSTASITVPWYRVKNFSALQNMSDGSSIDVSSSSAWSSSNPAVAGVGTNGQAIGAGVGQTVIGASYQGMSAQAILTAQSVAFGIKPGNPDSRFLPDFANGGDYGDVSAFAVQADGKVIVGGQFTSINGIAKQNLARLNEDGSVDTTFNAAGGPNGAVKDIALDSTGSVIIAGSFTSVGGTTRNSVARLTSSGAVDSAFNANFVAASQINRVRILPDGGMLVGGSGLRITGDAASTYLYQLDASGVKVSSFSAGAVSSGEVDALSIQPDGKILIGGTFSGTGSMGPFCVARLQANGAFDPNFANGITQSRVYDLALQLDGKLIVVGDFSSVQGNAIKFITRLNADGTLDNSFTSPTTASGWGIVQAVALQKNGKIIVEKFLGTVRLTASGSVDASYQASVQPDWEVHRIFVTPDEKIWISGGVTSVNGVPTMGVARLHGDVTTFLGWQTQYFSNQQLADSSKAGPNGNAAGDGVSNLLKYAWGADPRTPATDKLPGETLVTNGVDSSLQFTYRRLRLASDLTYEVGLSTDLQSWNYSGASLEQVGVPVVNADGLTENVTVLVMGSMLESSQLFMRLRVTGPP